MAVNRSKKNLLINPQYPIKPDALKVHGITVDMVRNQPTFAECADELLEFFGRGRFGGL